MATAAAFVPLIVARALMTSFSRIKPLLRGPGFCFLASVSPIRNAAAFRFASSTDHSIFVVVEGTISALARSFSFSSISTR
jgi:hypothetical protein